MKQKFPNPDRLNHAPDNADAALVLIDVINDLEFDGGERLLRYALPMADSLAALKRRAKAAGIPAIYANDNLGRWRSDFPRLVSISWSQMLGDDLLSRSSRLKRMTISF